MDKELVQSLYRFGFVAVFMLAASLASLSLLASSMKPLP